MMQSKTLMLPDEQATLDLGAAIALGLSPGTRLYLSGELGAGKTTLVRGMLRQLGHLGPVKSPTYTLVELYKVSRLDLHHFDFYRFNNASEWEDAGFREMFGGDGVCIVEWPEKVSGPLPPPDLHIALHHMTSGRKATLSANSARGHYLMQQVGESMA